MKKPFLKVLCEEECGYAFWLWSYPGTKEELVRDWELGKSPAGGIHAGRFEGEVRELTGRELAQARREFYGNNPPLLIADATADFGSGECDTLKIDGAAIFYEHP